MSVNPGVNESVTLLPLDVTMKQSLDMVLFSIADYDLVNAMDPAEGIRMTITLKRKIMSEIMTTYFPSLLLMMITYATTFFNLREGEHDSLEDNGIQPSTPTKDNPEITMEDETKLRVAWTISQREFLKVSSLTMLTMIGKVLIHSQDS